ncbi:hypothetical protein VHEMI08288 [[Torrubiella] hemipterigena]|nr:hypothetical protein VHEMI08288 [[Torrubiella] hemipterigena]
MMLIAALYVEHFFSYAPSLLLGFYYSLMVLFGIVKSRSLAMRPGLEAIFATSVASTVLALLIVISQEWPKRPLLLDRQRQLTMGTESLSGFWCRSVFWWVNFTLVKGFVSIFYTDDLPPMEEALTSQHLYDQFRQKWAKTNKTSAYSLLSVCTKLVWSQFLIGLIPKIALVVLLSIQPVLTKTVVTLAGQETIPENVVGATIGGGLLLYFGISLSNAINEYFVTRQVLTIRSCLIPAIYAKLFNLPLESLKHSNALTLTSADIDNIVIGIVHFNKMLQNSLLTISGLVVLGFLVGIAAVFAVVPALITMIISIRLAKQMRPAQTIWNMAVDKRLSATRDALTNLISVKMAGLVNIVSESLQRLVVDEMNGSKKARRLMTSTYVVGEITGAWMAIVVLAAALFWTRASTGLSKAEIYAIISVCNLITDPLALVTLGFSRFTSALASLDRMQTFLRQDDHPDIRETFAKAANEMALEKPAILEKSSESKLHKDGSAIKLVDVSTKPLRSGQQVFRNLTVSFPAKQLSLVVGPVGIGKSTFLKTIIGEVSIYDGHVLVEQDDIAYCGESPWLQNTTIQGNIVGDYPFSDIRYHSIIEACALVTDIDALSEGNETVVGDLGCNLSGGQRQRVALARAMYSAKPIIILDNSFSGLDAQTAALIYRNLFGLGGLLRVSETTTIMTTTMAEHLEFAAQVVVLGEHCTTQVVKPEDYANLPPYISRRRATETSDSESEQFNEDESQPRSRAVQHAMAQEPEVPSEKQLARQRGDFGMYNAYIKSIGWGRYLFWLLLTAFSVVVTRFPVAFIRIWYSKDGGDTTYFAGFATIYFFSTFTWILAYGYWYNNLILDSVVNLHRDLLHSVMRSTLSFISGVERASLLNRFSEDMAIFSQQLGPIMTTVVSCLFLVIADFILVCTSSAISVILIPSVVVPVYLLQSFYLRTSRQMRQLSLETKVPIVKQITEVSSGIEHIRAMKMQDYLLADGFKHIDNNSKPVYMLRCIQQWLWLVINLVVTFIAVMIMTIALTARHLASDNSIGVGMVALIPLSDNLGNVIRSWMSLETSLGAMWRLKWFTENTPTEQNETALDADDVRLKNWPETGAIEFREVNASYSIGSRRVLGGLSFSVAHGQTFGLIGRTGSGKSSILLTALNFLNYAGVITIGNLDLRNIPLDILRRRITTITQSSIELPGSVRANLYPYPDSATELDDKVIIDVLEFLGIWDYVDANGGLDADIAHLKLSTGQRQLINIARAFLHHKQNKSRIALMDEVTTSLDEATAKRVLEAIEDTFEDCTILMVEHRESALEHMDLSLELRGGYAVALVDRTKAHQNTLAAIRERKAREQSVKEEASKGSVGMFSEVSESRMRRSAESSH